MKTILLGDVCKKVTSGGTPSTRHPEYYDGNIPWLRTQEVNFTSIYSTEKTITEEGLKKSSAKIIPENSVIVAMYGVTAGKSAINKIPLTTNQACCNLIIDPTKADYRYIYYSLLNDYEELLASAIGAAQQNLSVGRIVKRKLRLTDLNSQKEIAEILAELDEKIDLNRRMNETLEKIGQALFKHYFINNPEAKTWPKGRLGEITLNFDSKRIPLSSRQREERKGAYRYYGATSVMDYVDDYIFDGRYLLLAEDGSVIKEDGTPVLQYVWGKFWVNNHTHILQAKSPFTVEYLYLLLSQSNVQSLVSGAVQLKINQKALNSFPVLIPPAGGINDFNKMIEPLFAQIRNNSDAIASLTKLRDSLLPRLISGKIEI